MQSLPHANLPSGVFNASNEHLMSISVSVLFTKLVVLGAGEGDSVSFGAVVLEPSPSSKVVVFPELTVPFGAPVGSND